MHAQMKNVIASSAGKSPSGGLSFLRGPPLSLPFVSSPSSLLPVFFPLLSILPFPVFLSNKRPLGASTERCHTHSTAALLPPTHTHRLGKTSPLLASNPPFIPFVFFSAFSIALLVSFSILAVIELQLVGRH